MIIYVLNESFQRTGIIDNASSVIFTRRYNTLGDFEVYAAATDEIVQLLTTNPYVYRDGDNTLYVIEKINIKSDSENGNYITVSGGNIATILKRRIIWPQTNFTGTVENAIRTFVNDNIINSSNILRNVSRFSLGNVVGLTDIITVQKTGQNLLEAVQELCQAYSYGFRVAFDGANLTFEIYKGEQKNVYFSPEFDNLISSEYAFSKENYADIAYVAGEGEGTARKSTVIGSGAYLNRYEIFVDARDLSSNDGEISPTDYIDTLKVRARENLATHTSVEKFSGDVSTENTYKLGVDYNLGDVVTIQNEYGLEATARIIETIECEDENGYSFIPTFDTWEVQ